MYCDVSRWHLDSGRRRNIFSFYHRFCFRAMNPWKPTWHNFLKTVGYRITIVLICMDWPWRACMMFGTPTFSGDYKCDKHSLYLSYMTIIKDHPIREIPLLSRTTHPPIHRFHNAPNTWYFSSASSPSPAHQSVWLTSGSKQLSGKMKSVFEPHFTLPKVNGHSPTSPVRKIISEASTITGKHHSPDARSITTHHCFTITHHYYYNHRYPIRKQWTFHCVPTGTQRKDGHRTVVNTAEEIRIALQYRRGTTALVKHHYRTTVSPPPPAAATGLSDTTTTAPSPECHWHIPLRDPPIYPSPNLIVCHSCNCSFFNPLCYFHAGTHKD